MTEAAKSQEMLLEQLLSIWQLQPHPEGGWYRELQRSAITVQRPDGLQRAAITTVLFLLGSEDVSRWHCVHGADEIWTFLDGDPLDLFQHPAAAAQSTCCTLQRDNPVAWVPAGVWMAARPQGAFSLVSCCVGPGFSFDDFELLRDVDPAQHPVGLDATLI